MICIGQDEKISNFVEISKNFQGGKVQSNEEVMLYSYAAKNTVPKESLTIFSSSGVRASAGSNKSSGFRLDKWNTSEMLSAATCTPPLVSLVHGTCK